MAIQQGVWICSRRIVGHPKVELPLGSKAFRTPFWLRADRHLVKTGIADCVETIYVHHVSGGISEITLKSYDQQRDAFQGTNRHVIWLDEECPYDIYVECLLRTMVVNGLVMMTATPLLGMTEVMRSFIRPAEGDESKFFVHATWNDVPHLDKAAKGCIACEYSRVSKRSAK